MITFLAALGLVCAVDAAVPRVDFLEWAALLDGARVVPPTGSTGSAVVDIVFDMDWPPVTEIWISRISYEGLSSPVTGAYLRWGHDGENGPNAFTLRSEYFPSNDQVVLQFPYELYGHIDSDSLYVVISTASYPDGEVRGSFTNITPPAAEAWNWGSIRWLFR